MSKDSTEKSEFKSDLEEYYFDAAGTRFSYAVEDLKQGMSRIPLVVSLVRGEFVNRYRGSVLGSLWITITTLMTVTGLAVLYSQLFGHALEEHFPYVCIGVVVWGILVTMITEGTEVFPSSAGVITQIPVPLSVFALRNVGRAIVNLSLRFLVLAGVLIYVDRLPDLHGTTYALLGLISALWIGFWCTLCIGVISTRYKDFQQLVSAGMTFAFFVTPVFWTVDRLGDLGFIVEYNPLYHMLHVIRGSLLDLPDVGSSWFWVAAMCVISSLVGFTVYGLYARRLRYWC